MLSIFQEKEKKWPIINEDYEFMDGRGTPPITLIKIIKGKYKNVIYHYRRVGINDPNEVPPKIKFEYYIVDSSKFSLDELKSDKKFVIKMGDILVSIFENNLLMKESDEPTRNDNPQESDLY